MKWSVNDHSHTEVWMNIHRQKFGFYEVLFNEQVKISNNVERM